MGVLLKNIFKIKYYVSIMPRGRKRLTLIEINKRPLEKERLKTAKKQEKQEQKRIKKEEERQRKKKKRKIN